VKRVERKEMKEGREERVKDEKERVKGGRERMYGKEYVKGKKKKNILFKRSM
jgi:hypothetical protein